MAKVALLIGVSDYQFGLNPLPAAVRDIQAIQQVLKHPDMGGFDQVQVLSNPDPLTMQESIEALFGERSKEDMTLLFFSGHGVKDDRGRLFFATCATRKTPKGELVKATAVPAAFVQDVMSNSRCKRQVVILDCCFSGAFAEGMTAKDDGTIDLQTQLGGEGRAVLTSSTATQYSFEQPDSPLSVYTRYIVEGIETGAADEDQDGIISIDELHEYARKKVQEAAPAMKPKIYAVEEGFRIHLAQAPTSDPKLQYRREVEACVKQGEITQIQRYILNSLRDQLGLSPETASTIESEVFQPYQARQCKLKEYRQVYTEAIQREKVLSDSTQRDLKQLQKVLGLRNEDTLSIAASSHVSPLDRAKNPSSTRPVNSPKTLSGRLRKSLLLGGTLLTLLSIPFCSSLHSPSSDPVVASSPEPTTGIQETPETETPETLTSETVTSADLYNQAYKTWTEEGSQATIPVYTQAIELNSDWGHEDSSSGYYGLFSALIARGNAYYGLGDYQKAFEDWDQAANLKTFSVAYYNRGLALQALGKHREAFENYDHAISLNQEWLQTCQSCGYYRLASAYYRRGQIRVELHDPKGAIEDYKQSEMLLRQEGATSLAEDVQHRIKALQL